MKFDKLFFRHDEAAKLGSSDKAVILEFIRWSCHFKAAAFQKFENSYFFDGHWWMQDSYEAWIERMPWLSRRTIARYLDELHVEGYLAKVLSGSGNGGRVPNFYRALEVECQNAQGGLSAKSAEVECQIGTNLSANLALSSLSKNHTKIPKNLPALFPSPNFIPPADLELAIKWLEMAKKEMPWQKNWKVEQFAADLNKIKHRTNLNDSGLEELFNFVKNDDWWRSKALSPAGLLTKSANGNKKIDNLIMAMKGGDKYKSAKEYEKIMQACANWDPSKAIF